MAKIKLCEICGHEFLCKTSAKVCSDECRKISYQRASRRAYENAKTKYTCIKCGKDKFTNNVPEDKLCRHCRKSHYQFKNQVTQQTLCKHCLKVLDSRTINLTRPDCEHIIWKVCDECNQINHELSSQRMKLNNPSYFGKTYSEEEYIKKKELQAAQAAYKKTDDYKQYLHDKQSQRMRDNNPMFREDVRLKMKQTNQLKLQNGTRIIKRGVASKLWKGNNNYVRNVLRRSLKFWRKENLERANYTCERCGKTNCQLHVHHKETFFDIVNKCAEELNLNIQALNVVNPDTNDYDSDFLLLEKAVVDYHKITRNLGIVVCLDCHDILDPQFRKPYRKKND